MLENYFPMLFARKTFTGFRLLFTGTLLLLSAHLAAQCPTLVWSDEFEGTTLDLNKWTPQVGDGCAQNLCGWGNNELQYNLAENAVVSNGTLKIIAKKETFQNNSYTSARLSSIYKGDWTYGRFEARMKLPAARGLWSAFWLLSTDETYGMWPQSGEIDVMELIGKEPNRVFGSIQYGNPKPNNSSQTSVFELNNGNFSDAFHTFAVEWEPGVIRWLVDDFLYATRRSTDVIPFQWPFDQRFHLLLKLAVGGNWPGSPDASTVFPQTLEVDYVRVYNGNFPNITGNRVVAHRAKNEVYTLNNVPTGATVTWSVPSGGTIVSGQGTNTITVDWEGGGGDLIATMNTACYSYPLILNIKVEPILERELVFENFDQPALIQFLTASGSLTEDVVNPVPNTINNSVWCGKYERRVTQQYDALQYATLAIPNAGAYFNGQKKFYIDIYTDAPPNTLIVLQLENSNTAAANNYPTGRHSRYQAYTRKQNEWHRLAFTPWDQPDLSTNDTSVDRLILLFAFNSLTSYTFYWDNFDSYAPETTPTRTIFDEQRLQIFPNPAFTHIILTNTLNNALTSLSIYNSSGEVILQQSERIEGNSNMLLDISHLSPGLYLLRCSTASGTSYAQRFIKL